MQVNAVLEAEIQQLKDAQADTEDELGKSEDENLEEEMKRMTTSRRKRARVARANVNV
jgi:hypothetical protein